MATLCLCVNHSVISDYPKRGQSVINFAYNRPATTQAAFITLCIVLCPLVQAQTVTVTAVGPPDETISQTYMALDDECTKLVTARQNPAAAVSACKKVADEADKFAPQSHFVTRRTAYVYYASALFLAKDYKAAAAVGDKAVAIVLLGHSDESGSSAAYGIRAQARAFAGDLVGANEDFEKAETYQRNGLNSPTGQELKEEYSRTLKGLLIFHAEVLEEMGNESAAAIKRKEANTL